MIYARLGCHVSTYHCRRHCYRRSQLRGFKITLKMFNTVPQSIFVGCTCIVWYMQTILIYFSFGSNWEGLAALDWRKKEEFQHIYHCVCLCVCGSMHVYYPTLSNSVYHFNSLWSDKCFAKRKEKPIHRKLMAPPPFWYCLNLYSYRIRSNKNNNNIKCKMQSAI